MTMMIDDWHFSQLFSVYYVYFETKFLPENKDYERKKSIIDEITWVCVRPSEAASSARSGNARYCVRWKRLLRTCNCILE